MKPTVHNLYKTPGWEKDTNYVYIGRPGKGRDGYFGNPIKPKAGATAGSTLEEFETYARKRIALGGTYARRVKELWGKKLVCFCSPKPCHGDVLAKLCEELNTK